MNDDIRKQEDGESSMSTTSTAEAAGRTGGGRRSTAREHERMNQDTEEGKVAAASSSGGISTGNTGSINHDGDKKCQDDKKTDEESQRILQDAQLAHPRAAGQKTIQGSTISSGLGHGGTTAPIGAFAAHGGELQEGQECHSTSTTAEILSGVNVDSASKQSSKIPRQAKLHLVYPASKNPQRQQECEAVQTEESASQQSYDGRKMCAVGSGNGTAESVIESHNTGHKLQSSSSSSHSSTVFPAEDVTPGGNRYGVSSAVTNRGHHQDRAAPNIAGRAELPGSTGESLLGSSPEAIPDAAKCISQVPTNLHFLHPSSKQKLSKEEEESKNVAAVQSLATTTAAAPTLVGEKHKHDSPQKLHFLHPTSTNEHKSLLEQEHIQPHGQNMEENDNRHGTEPQKLHFLSPSGTTRFPTQPPLPPQLQQQRRDQGLEEEKEEIPVPDGEAQPGAYSNVPEKPRRELKGFCLVWSE